MTREELELLLDEYDRREKRGRIWNFAAHDKQEEAINIFIAKGFILVLGGNRSGKTEVGAVIVGRELLSASDQKWWSLCPSFDLQKESTQEKIDYYLMPYYARNPIKNSNGAYSAIVLEKNSKLTFHSYEQGREKVQSAGLNGVWFDEEPPEEIFKEVTMRQKAGVPLKIVMTLTPLIGQKYIRELAKGKNVIKMSWRDNPHLTDKQIEDMRRGKSERELIVREHGGFADAIGRVITRLPSISEKKFNPIDRDIWDAVDPGFVDPTGYVQVAIDVKGKVTVIESWGESGLGYDQIAKKMKKSRGDKKIYRCMIDSAEPRLKKELSKHGILCRLMNKQPKLGSWDEFLASKANWFFENNMIEFMPGANEVLEQLEQLYWKVREGEQIFPEFDDHRKLGHHFDQAIALLYLLSEIHQKYVEKKEVKDNQIRYMRSSISQKSKITYKNINY